MTKKLSEPLLEELLDYYGNFTEDSRITGMIAAAGKAAGIFSMVQPLDDGQLDIAAAGDMNQIHTRQAESTPFPAEKDKRGK
jgi:hypothetical protein